ncbi:MAG: family flavoprotein [Hydrocarboniphaga sp.]|uniref:TIGR03862 family flavoprotein n=1 Tax=Hydrocarboniphaga sp. TaxID=2033016 RepID=UPI002639642E|nr:TIGR03862 family flavoprotein [Hydrocarboniphaga sp.]MDB5973063.1 family flavoprotein [Hydrocarboniphaga sp.]
MHSSTEPARVAIVGGGPAGLMAAEVARAAGAEVDLYERMGSVGRKFLLAGKGGLNLTHAEPAAAFVQRYAERQAEVGEWLAGFGADALRDWARGLGVGTFVGSSGRVFPADMKAAPLLRGWVRRLRAQGVRFHVEHRCIGMSSNADQTIALQFSTTQGERSVHTDAVIFGLGGGSWPELGSDGSWTAWLAADGVPIAPLRASNCGFELHWSEHFSARFAGQPLKPVVLGWEDAEGGRHSQQGELMITAAGLEGGLIYAMSAPLREAIAARGSVRIRLDLAPARDEAKLRRDIGLYRGKRSLSEHLRRAAGLDSLRIGLLYEVLSKEALADPATLAATIKALPLTLLRTRPLAEAISSAGGVEFGALDEGLMLRARPGVFCAGEMLDWEAPTGGYLLTACFASGRKAGLGAVEWLKSPPHRRLG